MSTRGTKNEDLGRIRCRMMADLLRFPPDSLQFLRAVEQVRGWLEAIADGDDPAAVMFSGAPDKNDNFAELVVFWVRVRMDHGSTQGEACRSVADWMGTNYERVLKIWTRHREDTERTNF